MCSEKILGGKCQKKRVTAKYSGKILGGKSIKKRVTAKHGKHIPCSQSLKLEINERLQVSRDELVDHEDDDDANQHHQRQRHVGKPKAIAALEVFGQPMDDHAYHDEDEHVAVVHHDVGYLAQVPMATHLVDHVLGGVPGRFVGHGGV